MWSRKRTLKKEKKQRNRKYYLLFIIASGIMGLSLIGLGILLIYHEPLFISPLPKLASWGRSIDEKDIKKEIETKLKEKNIEYSSVKKDSGDTYIITLKDKAEVNLSSKKDIAGQISSLQVILLRLTMEGKKFKRLDLRYDRPVILL